MYPLVTPRMTRTPVCLVSVALCLIERNSVYWSPSAKDAFGRDSFPLDEENSLFPLCGHMWDFAKPRKKPVHTILNADRDGCSVSSTQKALLIGKRILFSLRKEHFSYFDDPFQPWSTKHLDAHLYDLKPD